MTRADATGRRRGRFHLLSILAAAGLGVGATSLEAQSLRGSSAKLDRQNAMARQHDFTLLQTPDHVRSFVNQGLLVPVRPNADYDVLPTVSFPYARPEVLLFIERLGSQYRQACNEKLVVTSLTRPISRQPPNASSRSVHPTGMAVDLRVSANSRCRAWLENVLVQLDRGGVLDATREYNPPHYHVVVFPNQYRAYVNTLDTRAAGEAAPPPAAAEAVASTIAEDEFSEYLVRRGDSLWTIARRMGTTVERLQRENDLRTTRIYVGQVIVVPSR